jgi:hypothetical protein
LKIHSTNEKAPDHSGAFLVPMIAGREGGPSSDMQRYEG